MSEKFSNYKWKGSNQKGKTHKTCRFCGNDFMGKSDETVCDRDCCIYKAKEEKRGQG